jgi:hypothetical protein
MKMKWLLLGTVFTCGYLIGVEVGKKIYEQHMLERSKELLNNLRVVPMGMPKDGPSPFEEILGKIAKKEEAPS